MVTSPYSMSESCDLPAKRDIWARARHGARCLAARALQPFILVASPPRSPPPRAEVDCNLSRLRIARIARMHRPDGQQPQPLASALRVGLARPHGGRRESHHQLHRSESGCGRTEAGLSYVLDEARIHRALWWRISRQRASSTTMAHRAHRRPSNGLQWTRRCSDLARKCCARVPPRLCEAEPTS